MTISAHAPVPAGSRLIDADTADLAAIRRQDTNAGRFPANPPYAGRAAVPSGDDRYAEGYADGINRALTADRDLIERAQLTDPQRFHQLAEAIALGGEAGKDAVERLAREWGVFPEDSPTRPAGCPSWCSEDHRGQLAEVDGFTLGQVHERIVAELPAADPAWLDRPATAAVLVESTSEAGTGTTPPRVILAVAEGADGAHPGEQDCQGWTGTPAQARALAAALLAGAELVDGGDAR